MTFEINITPGARLLRMLGNLELKGWQCVAELIDNSIDGLIDINKKDKKLIEVYIPTESEIINDRKALSIRDNGKGMNKEDLENALTAGFSNRDATGENLGLFGVGFNVASARLGDKVTIRTSQDDMDHDILTTLDLIKLQDIKRIDKTTRIAGKKAPKTFESSGTEVQISTFHPRTKKLLKRRNIMSSLNEAYTSSLFEKYGIDLMINGNKIHPYIFCIWNKDRSVKHQIHGDIPAFYNIEKTILDKGYYSKKYETYVDEDTSKGLDKIDIIKRNIEIEGWLGIQRFLDPINFGINVIRNGRIILKLEKDMFFNWNNPDNLDPDAIKEHTKYWKDSYVEEYPIDNKVLGGRIVGEIHANFLHPNYTKDGLENDLDTSWIKVVRHLRGAGPFQPDLNEALGYEKNLSPLSMLYQGFRKSHPPGKRTLIGGDRNKNALHPKARTMASFFFNGKEDYQDDSKWYEMVLEAEIGLDPDEKGDPTKPKPPNENPPEEGPESEDEFPGAKKIDEKEYDIQSFVEERPIKVNIFEFKPTSINKNPIIFKPVQYAEFNAYINVNNDLFSDFPDDWEDLMLLEVAAMFQSRKADKASWQLSSIYYELKKKYQRDSMLDVNMLVNDSKGLIQEIQSYLAKQKNDVNIPIKTLLNDEELKVLKNNYLKIKQVNLDQNALNKVIKDSSYLQYMELKYIFKYISLLPEQILDDKFFNLPYSVLDDEQKKEYLDEYIGYVNDVKWFIYSLADMSPEMIKEFKDMIIRNRFGLRYLNQHRS